MTNSVDLYLKCEVEVFKSLNKTRGLFLRYRELLIDSEDSGDLESTTTELRNSLRSIEWDLEDLEDTILIADRNPKHKISIQELNQRKQFINATKNEIKSMKEKISALKNRDIDITAIQPLLEDCASPKRSKTASIGNNLMSNVTAAMHNGAKYSKLQNVNDSPHQKQINGASVSTQQEMLRSQDEPFDVMSDSLETLNSINCHIGIDDDEHGLILDELDDSNSKLEVAVRKIRKIVHPSNDYQKLVLIVLVIGFLLSVVIIFFTMS